MVLRCAVSSNGVTSLFTRHITIVRNTLFLVLKKNRFPRRSDMSTSDLLQRMRNLVGKVLQLSYTISEAVVHYTI